MSGWWLSAFFHPYFQFLCAPFVFKKRSSNPMDVIEAGGVLMTCGFSNGSWVLGNERVLSVEWDFSFNHVPFEMRPDGRAVPCRPPVGSAAAWVSIDSWIGVNFHRFTGGTRWARRSWHWLPRTNMLGSFYWCYCSGAPVNPFSTAKVPRPHDLSIWNVEKI